LWDFNCVAHWEKCCDYINETSRVHFGEIKQNFWLSWLNIL